MRFVKVVNNTIVEFAYPEWLDSNGQPITDYSLYVKEGYYPVDESQKPTVDPFYQTVTEEPFSNWTISTASVIPAYSVVDKSLTVKMKELKEVAKQNYEKLIAGGYNAKTIGKVINSTQADLINMQLLHDSLTSSNATNVDFRLKDNTMLNITVATLLQLINELRDWQIKARHAKWTKYTEIESKTTMADLKAIDLNIVVV